MTRRTASILAWGSCAVSVVLVVWSIVVTARNGPVVVTTYGADIALSVSATVGFGLVILAFAVVGTVVAVRRPENPIGWLFCSTDSCSPSSTGGSPRSTRWPGHGPGNRSRWACGRDRSATRSGAVHRDDLLFLLLLFPDGARRRTRWRFAGSHLAIAGRVVVSAFTTCYSDHISTG